MASLISSLFSVTPTPSLNEKYHRIYLFFDLWRLVFSHHGKTPDIVRVNGAVEEFVKVAAMVLFTRLEPPEGP
jgi:hypothetical protein